MNKILKKLIFFISFVLTIFILSTTNSFLIASANELIDECSNQKFNNNIAKNLFSICDKITDSKTEFINEKIEIYGNTNIDDLDFRKIVDSGSDKIYFIYFVDENNILPYDASLVIKSNGIMNSYEYKEMELVSKTNLVKGIISFVLYYVNIINQNKFYCLSSSTNNITTIDNSIPRTFVDCIAEKEFIKRFDDKGYIVYHVAVAQYVANNDSIIYIVSANNQFVPGIVAKKNNESGYGSYRNQEGFVHMKVDQALDASEEYYYGIRYGNNPYKKDFWPVNEPSVTTITSSINGGLNLGYSFENGFSLDNISVNQNRNIGANISYGYSKSITKTEPALSAQVNSDDTSVCEWYYTYSKDAEETYHLNTNYMFEISNSPKDMNIGDFRLKLDYKFVIDKGVLFKQQEVNCSSDLIVRPTQKSIYNFCNGMI